MSVSAAAPAISVPGAPKAGKRSRAWLWIVVLVLLAAAGGGGWWWAERQHAAPAPAVAKPARQPAQYYALEPAFVVNLADESVVRYLQADVQLMTRDAATLTAVEAHAPAIRNRLLLLFGQQTAARLAQRSAKERLQEKALAEVRQALKAEAAPDRIEAVLFTSLVTQ
jgi:flagellar FliL protein